MPVDAGLKAGDDTTRVVGTCYNNRTLAGEVKLHVSNEEVEQIVRDKVKEIGYEQDGFIGINLKFIMNYPK